MIEQTNLVVIDWTYTAPINPDDAEEKLTSDISLDIMKKRASDKKGIACRFSCRFHYGDDRILTYIAEDSYVIDLADRVDRNEILKMIRNSFSKFNEKFEFRKLGTVLEHKKLKPLNEAGINVDAIVPLLNEQH